MDKYLFLFHSLYIICLLATHLLPHPYPAAHFVAIRPTKLVVFSDIHKFHS